MATSLQFPPAAPTLSGDIVSANRFLNNTPWLMRALRSIADQMFISPQLLKGQYYTTSGSIGYQQNETIYADRAPSAVNPGAEYPQTPISLGTAQLANTVKWGEDGPVTDEAINRFQIDAVRDALIKLANSMIQQIDSVALSAISSAVTQNTACIKSWTGSAGAPSILRDVLLAVQSIKNLKQGYNPDTVLVDLTTWAYAISDPTLSLLIPREARDTPVFTGQMTKIAGMNWVTSPNLPTNGVATIVDSNLFGGFVDELLPAPGYMRDDNGIQMKSIREDKVDQYLVRARRITVPIVREPAAAWKITGVAA
jgi:hypothetical protein